MEAFPIASFRQHKLESSAFAIPITWRFVIGMGKNRMNWNPIPSGTTRVNWKHSVCDGVIWARVCVCVCVCQDNAVLAHGEGDELGQLGQRRFQAVR